MHKTTFCLHSKTSPCLFVQEPEREDPDEAPVEVLDSGSEIAEDEAEGLELLEVPEMKDDQHPSSGKAPETEGDKKSVNPKEAMDVDAAEEVLQRDSEQKERKARTKKKMNMLGQRVIDCMFYSVRTEKCLCTYTYNMLKY